VEAGIHDFNLGRAEGIVLSILDLLYDLGEVPEDMEVTVMGEDDLELLRKWLKIAAKANSIEEFTERSGITDNALT
jgi:predicted fused transcriptional regulator/phosphomethylpyrimidine kinase